jgi:hypothetical protein
LPSRANEAYEAFRAGQSDFADLIPDAADDDLEKILPARNLQASRESPRHEQGRTGK